MADFWVIRGFVTGGSVDTGIQRDAAESVRRVNHLGDGHIHESPQWERAHQVVALVLVTDEPDPEGCQSTGFPPQSDKDAVALKLVRAPDLRLPELRALFAWKQQDADYVDGSAARQ